MRYPASEKLEIIRLDLPAKRTLDHLGIPKTTFYRWYDKYLMDGPDALEDAFLAWKLCTTMKTTDVTETLELALQASGCDQANVVHKPRLLSDNVASYISGELADWLEDNGMQHTRGAPYHPQTQGKIERLKIMGASDPQKPCPAGELLPTRRFGGADQGFHRLLQSSSLP